jgi:hypothetical protein
MQRDSSVDCMCSPRWHIFMMVRIGMEGKYTLYIFDEEVSTTATKQVIIQDTFDCEIISCSIVLCGIVFHPSSSHT